MNRGWITRSMLLAFGLVLIVAMVSLSGCGKKAEVETRKLIKSVKSRLACKTSVKMPLSAVKVK